MAVRRSVQIQAPAREVEVVQAKKIRRIMRTSLAKRAKEVTSRSQGQKTLRIVWRDVSTMVRTGKVL